MMQLETTRLDSHAPSFMHPAGAPADVQAALGWPLTIVAIATVVIVSVILIIALVRRRPPPTPTDEIKQGERRAVVSGVNWIYIGLAITVVVLLATFGATVATLAASSRAPHPPPIALDVTAHQWWWEVHVSDSVPSDAFTTANEVHVPVGVPVLLRVQSPDVIHSFWVPELGGKIDVIPGQINESWIQANRAGLYRGQCAEYCGLQHAHMAFTVVAESRDKYEAWAAHQRSEAVIPAPNTAAAAGEVVFRSTCGGCHTARGSGALGRIGPDLTHVSSRYTIGAGLIDNNLGTMTTWVRNPQLLKEGVFMPPMDLRQNELQAVVAYVESLQ